MSRTSKKETPEFEDDVSILIEYITDKFQVFKVSDKEDEKYLLYDLKNDEFGIHNPRSFNATLFIKLSNAGVVFNMLERKDVIDILIKRNLIEEVHGIGYRPNKEIVFSFDDKRYFNRYRFSKIEEQVKKDLDKFVNKISVKEGLEVYKFPYLHKLISHVLGIWEEELKESDEKEKLKIEWNEKIIYFYKWISFIEQNPTTKLKTSLILQGTQSTGKGLLQDIMIKLFGRSNLKTISQGVLDGKFSNYVEHKRFIFGNEIQFNFKSVAYESLKMFSSDKNVDVEGKNKDTYGIENFAHFIFFTNNENPLRIESNDTRHSVFYQENCLPKEIISKLTTFKENKYLEDELLEFCKFMHHIETSFEVASIPLETTEKNKIKDYHKDDVTRFIEWCQSQGNFQQGIQDLNLTLIERENVLRNELGTGISNSQLFLIYSYFCKSKNIRINRQQDSFLQMLKKYSFNTIATYDKTSKKTIRMKLKEEIFFNFEVYIINQIKSNKEISKKELSIFVKSNKFLTENNCNDSLNNLIQASVIVEQEEIFTFSSKYNINEESIEIINMRTFESKEIIKQ